MDKPELYVGANSMQMKDVANLLEERRKYLEWGPGEKVLDIGCGPGDVTTSVLFPLLPEDSTLVGCDISPEMITYCNEFKKNSRISFKVQDIQGKTISSELQLESFDKIVSFYCLHWITDQRQAIQNIFSLLKPGGEILLMFITPDHPFAAVTEKLRVLKKWNIFIKNKRFFYQINDPASYFLGALQELGFHNVNCYIKKRAYLFPSWEHIKGFVNAVDPYLRCVPEDLNLEYVQDFINVLTKEKMVKIKENGEVIVEYSLIVAAAKKPKK